MAGNRHHDSPGREAGTRGFLGRWSARKRAAAPAGDTSPPAADRRRKPLTDRDMPPLESLDEDSDYSDFLSKGVSEGLQRLALRKLFHAAKFNVCDGLDDYDTDYNQMLPLRQVLAGMTQDDLAPRLQRAPANTPARDETPAPQTRARSPAPDEEPVTPQTPGTNPPGDDREQGGA